ncbi:hypothetical protein D3C71_1887500 [compost metagenome]
MTLAMSSMKLKASVDQCVEMTNSDTMALVAHRARDGTPLRFCPAKNRGMSCDCAAAYSTSAPISVQAR